MIFQNSSCLLFHSKYCSRKFKTRQVKRAPLVKVIKKLNPPYCLANGNQQAHRRGSLYLKVAPAKFASNSKQLIKSLNGRRQLVCGLCSVDLFSKWIWVATWSVCWTMNNYLVIERVERKCWFTEIECWVAVIVGEWDRILTKWCILKILEFMCCATICGIWSCFYLL